MTTKKIYGPWIEWHGGDCPVPPDTMVEVKLRSGKVLGPDHAFNYYWHHDDDGGDIVEYRTVSEQPDLEAADRLLRANGYNVVPPVKPLTFEDVVPMTEAPPRGTDYWVICPWEAEGVFGVTSSNDGFDRLTINRGTAYLEKEDALIAARHIFGLKGGEL